MESKGITELWDTKRLTLIIPKEIDEAGNIERTKLNATQLDQDTHHEVHGKCIFLCKEFDSIREVKEYVESILYNSDCIGTKVLDTSKYLEAVMVLWKWSYEICYASIDDFRKSKIKNYVRLREGQWDRKWIFILTVKARSLKELLRLTYNKIVEVLDDSE